MRVGADQRIGIRLPTPIALLAEDDAGKVLEIDLVHDARIGRNDSQVAKGSLAPAQKSVAFFIALEFEQRVHLERIGRAELIHLDGVVDDQFGRLQGIDERRVTAQALHGIAHSGEINHRGHTGEVLQEHPAWGKSNLLIGFVFAVPRG